MSQEVKGGRYWHMERLGKLKKTVAMLESFLVTQSSHIHVRVAASSILQEDKPMFAPWVGQHGKNYNYLSIL